MGLTHLNVVTKVWANQKTWSNNIKNCVQSGFEQHVEYVELNVIKSEQKISKQPLEHLPLQESVKVHGVLVVFKRSPTQVVMNGPGQTHSTSQRTLRQHSYNWCNVMWCKLYMAGRKQVRLQQTGEGTAPTHLRQLLKISLHGLSSRFSLHWSAKTSAMSTRWGDYISTCKHTQWHTHTHIDKCITFYCTHQSNWGETYITPQREQNSIRT